jgi:small-conductance mechanosensitive channel
VVDNLLAIDMFDPTIDKIVITIVVVAAIAIFRLTLGAILRRKLRGLPGHQLLANFISVVLSIVLVFYLLNVWGITQALLEWLAALGTITAVLLITMKDVWITNLFAGISLIGDKSIDIGTDVEIQGQRGKIVEMTLTITKVKTADGNLMIVPNKKFREEIVIVRAGKKRR